MISTPPPATSSTPEAFDPHWAQVAIGRSRVEMANGLRLLLEEASTGQLALAQLDDYVARPRERYLWRPPLVLETRARFSHPGGELQGTAGFGFWNNPAPLWGTRLEASPRWLWFYYASPASTLSLLPGPPNGFKAAVVHGGKAGGLAMTLFQALLKAPATGRRLAGTRLPAVEMTLNGDLMATWHTYRIAWLPSRIAFQVDGQAVLETGRVPPGPLAFVAWIDNNYAALDERGEMQLGHLAIGRPQWLELEYLSIRQP